ncbi:MAG: hypothetical protein M1829_002218 [Trizodia sp. TS-e1964]|nr:MAG: hypothetical protein M1829_002218 [Trizodia sp. TS-e1964]
MGVDARKHRLPPPTEPSTLVSSGSAPDTDQATDLATDLSTRTEQTSYSIPEDGRTVSLPIRPRKTHEKGSLAHARQHSHTSLLIEYFEAGKEGGKVRSRPSVRVKVTPSGSRKSKDTNEHVHIRETAGSRRPSYTKRVSLSPNNARAAEGLDDRSSSYTSAADDSNVAYRSAALEVEVMHLDNESLRSGKGSPRDARYVQPNPSEVSTMPPESFLGTRDAPLRRNRSRSESRDAAISSTNLKTPSRRRSRSLSRERIVAQKAVEKVRNKRVESEGKRGGGEVDGRSRKNRSRSASIEKLDVVKTPSRRRSSKTHRDEALASVDSSLLTAETSPKSKAGDQYSFRSGTSRSSLNNPRLLETVEDAIRRLILPELVDIKNARLQSNRTEVGPSRESSLRQTTATRDSFALSPTVDESPRRRVSKTSSAPDVKRSKLLTREEEQLSREALTPASRNRRERGVDRQRDGAASEKSTSERYLSQETVTQVPLQKKKSKDRYGLSKGLAAVGIGVGVGGALTAAALHRNESRESMDRKERRKKRGGSRSRSASISESVESSVHVRRENILPLPMMSDIHGSDLTRASILTEITAADEVLETERLRASSHEPSTPVRELTSSASRTPTRTPVKGLFTHHSNHSRGDLSLHGDHGRRNLHEETTVEAGSSQNYAHEEQHFSHEPHRGLSPIQSVASYEEEASGTNRNSFGVPTNNVPKDGVSLDVLSPASEHFGHEERADGEYWQEQHQENDRNRSFDDDSYRHSTIDVKHMTNYTDDSMDAPYLDKVTAGQHVLGVGSNPEYVHTPLAVESAVASLHEPSMLDGGSMRSFRSKGADQYAESLDGVHQDEEHQYAASDRGLASERGSPLKSVRGETTREGISSTRSSPTKQLHQRNNVAAATGYSQKSFHERALRQSPTKSLAESVDGDDHVQMQASGFPDPNDPMPDFIDGGDEHSDDVTTNPSIIQGPIGGAQRSTRDHWPYEPTPPQSNGNLIHTGEGVHDESDQKSDSGGLGIRGATAIAGGAAVGAATAVALAAVDEHEHGKDHAAIPPTPTVEDAPEDDRGFPATNGVLAKDEGYISSANARSPGAITPDAVHKPFDFLKVDRFDEDETDDPFYTKGHARHISGNSHGMPSPLYDSATGRGIDRIQSKDIVALMDHLTVRDAQRNARDTEILVTLVRSAAEMRNSFEDMKRLLGETEGNIVEGVEKNTERSVQKIIQGPRPQPLGAPRVPRRASAEEEAIESQQAKRRNVFRRALKGLSMRSSNDLAKIEEMLVQLLGEVEGLKAVQDFRPSVGTSGTQPGSLNSYENLRATREGYTPGEAAYEPGNEDEGRAGVSPGAINPRHSNSLPNLGVRNFDGRRPSTNRISTVVEGDEEQAEREAQTLQTQNEHGLLTPRAEILRGSSVPLDTPPQQQQQQLQPQGKARGILGTLSNENTPKTEKGKKHKSTSSSIFPKFSRWSETTTSTLAKNFRSSARKEKAVSKDYSEAASHSGSEGADYWENHDPNGPDKLHSGFSTDQLPDGADQRPPSPLMPNEDPKYKAHRNSLNLQHPQPRPGPTHRYQTHLESQAHNFHSPISPSSEQWGSNPALKRFSAGSGTNTNRFSGEVRNLSPISDAGYSQGSAADEAGRATPRIPKPTDSEPLVPQTARSVNMRTGDTRPHYASPLGANHGHVNSPVSETRYGEGSVSFDALNASPRSARSTSGQVPQRKPTGPRPISSASNQRADNLGTVRRPTRDTFGYNSNNPRDHDDDTF